MEVLKSDKLERKSGLLGDSFLPASSETEWKPQVSQVKRASNGALQNIVIAPKGENATKGDTPTVGKERTRSVSHSQSVQALLPKKIVAAGNQQPTEQRWKDSYEKPVAVETLVEAGKTSWQSHQQRVRRQHRSHASLTAKDDNGSQHLRHFYISDVPKSPRQLRYESFALQFQAAFRELHTSYGNQPVPNKERTQVAFELLDALVSRLPTQNGYQELAQCIRDEIFVSVYTESNAKELVPFFDLVQGAKEECTEVHQQNVELKYSLERQQKQIDQVDSLRREVERLNTKVSNLMEQLSDERAQTRQLARILQCNNIEPPDL